MSEDLFFDAFTRRWASDFRKLSYMTKGEKEVGDLISDAWLLSFELERRLGRPVDFTNVQDQHMLIRWLNFEITRKADLPYRFAERPDAAGDEFGLWDVLEADSSADPLERLTADQASASVDELRATSYSQYVAYWVAWHNSDQDMGGLATQLAITHGALIQRLRRFNATKERQFSLFDRIEQIPEDFLPKTRQAAMRFLTIEIAYEQYLLLTEVP